MVEAIPLGREYHALHNLCSGEDAVLAALQPQDVSDLEAALDAETRQRFACNYPGPLLSPALPDSVAVRVAGWLVSPAGVEGLTLADLQGVYRRLHALWAAGRKSAGSLLVRLLAYWSGCPKKAPESPLAHQICKDGNHELLEGCAQVLANQIPAPERIELLRLLDQSAPPLALPLLAAADLAGVDLLHELTPDNASLTAWGTRAAWIFAHRLTALCALDASAVPSAWHEVAPNLDNLPPADCQSVWRAGPPRSLATAAATLGWPAGARRGPPPHQSAVRRPGQLPARPTATAPIHDPRRGSRYECLSDARHLRCRAVLPHRHLGRVR